MNMVYKIGLAVIIAAFTALPAQAKNMPEINPSLKSMLGALPIAGGKDKLKQMIEMLKKTSCGSSLKDCYMAQSGEIQLYFFSSKNAQQTFLIVLDKKISLPTLLKSKIQKMLLGSTLNDPIIAISTTDFTLNVNRMPTALRTIVKNSYYNVNSLSFLSGVQVMSSIKVSNTIKKSMNTMGVSGNKFTLRAGLVLPIPTDFKSGLSSTAQISASKNLKQGMDDAADIEAYVEFQLPPNQTVKSMMGTGIALSDLTITISNAGIFGLKGNAKFRGLDNNKKMPLTFNTPLTPAGAMDFADFEFRIATPANFTLEDYAYIVSGFASTKTLLSRYGGGFIKNVSQYQKTLMSLTKPLSVFKLKNPSPPPNKYKFGDNTFPTDAEVFNIILLGPLADGGPLLKVEGNANILGQTMGVIKVNAGLSGLQALAKEQITIRLGPLGKQRIMMQSTVDINANEQKIELKGNVLGRALTLALNRTELHINSPATCATPFEIKATVTITANLNIANVFEHEEGVNVDPAKLNNCIGAELEKALNTISNEYKSLSGYSANKANQALKKIADDKYQEIKSIARAAANANPSNVMKEFKNVGNALKNFGKKKHKKGNNRLSPRVFDWDYYYDHNPDVVKAGLDLAQHWVDHGFLEDRKGSNEFHLRVYRALYVDVHGNYDDILNHWLGEGGLSAGRTASTTFSVKSLLRHNPSLNAYDDWQEVFRKWLNRDSDWYSDPQCSSESNCKYR